MRNKSITYFLLTVIFQLNVFSGWSQVSFNFNAAVYGQSVDGLSLVQLINSSDEDVVGKVKITVTELTAGTVLTLSLNSVRIRRGTNPIDRSAFSNAVFSFSNSYYGITARQGGKFPEGEYEYCFAVEISDHKTQWPADYFENCFIQQVQPLTPLILINPLDGDESCNSRPDFTWLPPLPMPASAKSRLVLTEIKEKQDIAEAINFNLPLINQGNISGNQLMYPVNLPELKQGKKYAWQVTVYLDKTVLKKSEIWTYELKCESQEKETVGDGYRELKENNDGNFYVATRVLRFSFNNSYNAGALDYSISSLADPDLVIKGLPSLKMLPGINKYDINLQDIKSFEQDQEYLLKVKLPGGRELRLRFLYKTE